MRQAHQPTPRAIRADVCELPIARRSGPRTQRIRGFAIGEQHSTLFAHCRVSNVGTRTHGKRCATYTRCYAKEALTKRQGIMNVAIVHDWLIAPDGPAKVLEQIIECFPDADLFSLVDFLEDRRPLGGKPVTTSFIQRLPYARRHCRAYLPLIPLAVGQFDLSGYDFVITSSEAAAMGVLAGPDQIHVSYLHSATRHAWDLQRQYLREANLTRGLKSSAARALLHWARGQASDALSGADCLIASSRSVARHVMKTCRRAFLAEITRAIAAARGSDELSHYSHIAKFAICE